MAEVPDPSELVGSTVTESGFKLALTKLVQAVGQLLSEAAVYAKTYADQNFAKIATIIPSKNLYNPASKIADKYINTSGLVKNITGWGIVLIPVTSGQQVTLSSNAPRRAGSVFLTDNTLADSSVIAGSYLDAVTTASTSVTLTVPASATYLAINVYSTTVPEPTQIQVEVGSVATAYEPFANSGLSIKSSALPTSLVYNSQIPALVAKSYEQTVSFKNLFNKNTIKDGYYLNNSGVIAAAAGWGCSDYIPVVAGQYYTLSGVRSRIGAAFFTSNATITPISGSYNGSSAMPLTLLAPAGATHMIVNLYTSTASNYSQIQVEVGQSATAYEEQSGSRQMVKAADIYPPVSSSSGFADATLAITSSTTASITAKLSTTNTLRSELITAKTVNHDQANTFNFADDYVNNVLVRNVGDDSAPYRIFGTTVGANHGYSKTTVTLASHGKTNADVGSIWSDGSKQWVIVEIISTSQISITSRADNTAFASGTLTHVSGASSTGSMTPTAAVASAWFPVSRNRNLTCSVDGVSVDLSSVASYSYKSNATFCESYDIMAKADIVEWIILNKGTALLYYYAAPSITVSMSYRFDTRGGCTISTDFAALKAISAFQDIMFTQSVKMNTSNGAVNFYIPKTLPFVHESVNYDFSVPTSLDSTTLATRINFTAARCVADGQLADRVIQLNNTIGYATGYLPVLDTASSVRRTNASNKALQISEAKKTYMSCIDGLKTSLVAGDYFRTVCYRNYFEVSSARTACYVVESGQGDYLYVDYHAAHANTLDRIVLPPKFHGKTAEVVEKSSNVTLLSGGTSAAITSSVGLKVGAYQSSTYAVLKMV